MFVWVSHLAADVLWNVWNDLHATWNDTLRTAVTHCVGRSCWSTEALCELLNQRAADIVGCDVDGISNAKDNKGAFGREGEARLGSIESSTGSFLNFTDPDSLLADYRADEDVWDEETERVGT
jgi:hypothetical protein